MAYRRLRDKEEVLARLQDDLPLHIYEIGDLDDFFWPHTQCFAGEERSLALVYGGMAVPCLLAFEAEDHGALSGLLDDIAPELATALEAHVSPHLEPVLARHFRIESRSEHYKMALERGQLTDDFDASGCITLGPSQLRELQSFYATAYPDNWFDPRTLETGYYVGARVDGQLGCVAGVHVYSADYRVAALGNIATAPEHRRRGLARACTGALCRRLFERVACIGLNVQRDNHAAMACYRRLGFRKVADYHELTLRKKPG